MAELSICETQVDELLNLPTQIWLLGAGVSNNSGIPLMADLTSRIEVVLEGEDQSDFGSIRAALPPDAHVEHVLSHISDHISLASRTASHTINLDEKERTIDELREFHSRIQREIRDIVRFGYSAPNDEKPERIGTLEKPIVSIDDHLDFVEAVFRSRRAGLERRPPVSFFTTNYDTLLEDALALGRIQTSDGFSGGTMAFWDPASVSDVSHTNDARHQAIIHKLHGSIDWFLSPADVVVRRREGADYPLEANERLLIYPQATKYQITQRDPFASLFTAFRSALTSSESGLFAICGYSFRDDHINEQIDRAMSLRGSSLTMIAFVKQNADEIDSPTQGLPDALAGWTDQPGSPWRERLVVAGSLGFYHGSMENRCWTEPDSPHNWWSFDGLTSFLRHGPTTEP